MAKFLGALGLMIAGIAIIVLDIQIYVGAFIMFGGVLLLRSAKEDMLKRAIQKAHE